MITILLSGHSWALYVFEDNFTNYLVLRLFDKPHACDTAVIDHDLSDEDLDKVQENAVRGLVRVPGDLRFTRFSEIELYSSFVCKL